MVCFWMERRKTHRRTKRSTVQTEMYTIDMEKRVIEGKARKEQEKSSSSRDRKEKQVWGLVKRGGRLEGQATACRCKIDIWLSEG